MERHGGGKFSTVEQKCGAWDASQKPFPNTPGCHMHAVVRDLTPNCYLLVVYRVDWHQTIIRLNCSSTFFFSPSAWNGHCTSTQFVPSDSLVTPCVKRQRLTEIAVWNCPLWHKADHGLCAPHSTLPVTRNKGFKSCHQSVPSYSKTSQLWRSHKGSTSDK